jgi:hypothetical protein
MKSSDRGVVHQHAAFLNPELIIHFTLMIDKIDISFGWSLMFFCCSMLYIIDEKLDVYGLL